MNLLHVEGGTRTVRPYLVWAPYIIWSYDYSYDSAGPMALHRLCHELNEAGQKAYIGKGWATNPVWNAPLWDGPLPDDWIAVYPEIVRGNPWNAPRVARWALNVPGLLGGDKVYDPTEMVFAWDRRFLDGVPLLQVPNYDLGLYHDRHEPRAGELYYVGKGAQGETHGASPITLEMRRDPRAMADVLNHATLLRSFDPASGMNSLAMLSGCPVLLPSGERLEPADFQAEYAEVIAGWPAQLQRFIEITQAPPKICAVIPTRFRPPELEPLLAVLKADGVCVHLTVDPEDSEHRIYRMWNDGADAARAHGARYIAVLNDDISLVPGTLPLFARMFAGHEALRKPSEPPLGALHPEARLEPWALPSDPRVEPTGVLLGCCFFFRADIGIRFDESYRWWYGDNQFDKDLRQAGWLVGRAVGVPYHHRPETSTRRAWDYLGPLTALDRQLWESRGGDRWAVKVQADYGSSYR
jgi:hypothetical protein